jgi:dihydroorotase
MGWDLLLQGAKVIDVGGGHVGRFDIALQAGRVAEVAPRLEGRAAQTLDLTGKLVTPGLVDLHTHVFAGGGYWGIDPAPIAWRSGVTTWVDAGSCGAYNFPAFRERLSGYPVKVPVLLHVSAIGLTGQDGEARDLKNLDVSAAVATVRANREHIVGIKVRMARGTVGRNALEPLHRAIEVAAACELPLMVHIGDRPPNAEDVVPLLRPGDIITHCASGIAAGPHLLAPQMREAYERGVAFDIGHGAGSFAFDVLEAQLEAGLPPHSVSTDLHSRCVHGPVFDMPTTMAKMLAVGMSLEQVVQAATAGPARLLGLDAGTLAVGSRADLAVFTLQEGRFELVDVHGNRRVSPLRLRNEATYVAGRPLAPVAPEPPPPWVALTPAQRDALSEEQRALRHLMTEPLVGPDGVAEQFPRV